MEPRDMYVEALRGLCGMPADVYRILRVAFNISPRLGPNITAMSTVTEIRNRSLFNRELKDGGVWHVLVVLALFKKYRGCPWFANTAKLDALQRNVKSEDLEAQLKSLPHCPMLEHRMSYIKAVAFAMYQLGEEDFQLIKQIAAGSTPPVSFEDYGIRISDPAESILKLEGSDLFLHLVGWLRQLHHPAYNKLDEILKVVAQSRAENPPCRCVVDYAIEYEQIIGVSESASVRSSSAGNSSDAASPRTVQLRWFLTTELSTTEAPCILLSEFDGLEQFLVQTGFLGLYSISFGENRGSMRVRIYASPTSPRGRRKFRWKVVVPHCNWIKQQEPWNVQDHLSLFTPRMLLATYAAQRSLEDGFNVEVPLILTAEGTSLRTPLAQTILDPRNLPSKHIYVRSALEKVVLSPELNVSRACIACLDALKRCVNSPGTTSPVDGTYILENSLAAFVRSCDNDAKKNLCIIFRTCLDACAESIGGWECGVPVCIVLDCGFENVRRYLDKIECRLNIECRVALEACFADGQITEGTAAEDVRNWLLKNSGKNEVMVLLAKETNSVGVCCYTSYDAFWILLASHSVGKLSKLLGFEVKRVEKWDFAKDLAGKNADSLFFWKPRRTLDVFCDAIEGFGGSGRTEAVPKDLLGLYVRISAHMVSLRERIVVRVLESSGILMPAFDNFDKFWAAMRSYLLSAAATPQSMDRRPEPAGKLQRSSSRAKRREDLWRIYCAACASIIRGLDSYKIERPLKYEKSIQKEKNQFVEIFELLKWAEKRGDRLEVLKQALCESKVFEAFLFSDEGGKVAETDATITDVHLAAERQRFRRLPPAIPVFVGRLGPRMALELNLLGDGREAPARGKFVANRQRRGTVRVVVLYGMGGVGKSMLAARYAVDHRERYGVLWWIDAESRNSTEAALMQLGIALGVCGALEKTHAAREMAAVRAVRALKSLPTMWLLVFDNAHDPAVLDGLIPSNFTMNSEGEGHIIITSRRPANTSLDMHIPIGVFDRAESVELLRQLTLPRARESARIDESEGYLSDEDEGVEMGMFDVESAWKLAELVGDLPLALAQAGSYVSQTMTSLRAYVRWFQTRWLELMKDSIHNVPPGPYKKTVLTAWKVSIEMVRAENPDAEGLLRFCSLIDARDIPLRLLVRFIAISLSKSMDSARMDTYRAVVTLRSCALISESEARGAQAQDSSCTVDVCMHRVVQAAVREIVLGAIVESEGEKETGVELSGVVLTLHRALRAIQQEFGFSPSDRSTWAAATQIAAHGKELVENTSNWIVLNATEHFPRLEKSFSILVRTLLDVAKTTCEVLCDVAGVRRSARSTAEAAMDAGLAVFKEDHPYLAASYSDFGLVDERMESAHRPTSYTRMR